MSTIQLYKCRLVKDGAALSIGETPARADNPKACERLFRQVFGGLPHEEMWSLLLNAKTEIVGVARVSMGGIHGCGVTPGDIFRPAIAAAARGVVLAHNHPSGDFTPSAEDIEMTRQVVRGGKTLGIDVHDHLIFTPNGDWIAMGDTPGAWPR